MLYPDPQWRLIAGLWERLYPVAGLASDQVRIIRLLERMSGPAVSLLTGHRPPALRGRSLLEAVAIPSRAPSRLAVTHERWLAHPELMRDAAPTLVFAVFGHARATGRLTPEQEDRKLGELITWWAVQTTPNAAYFAKHSRAVTAGHRPAALADVMSGEEPWN
jgi:hypothetical protein